VSFAEAAAVKGDADATRTLFETKQRSWQVTADKIKDEDPDAYAYLTGERTNRTGEALPALAGTYTLAFPVFAFALMMAGYLVIRFVVMTAPVWATVATVPQTQGILRSAASVAAAAIVHPVIMAVGASISVLTTGYLLDPDTGLGWLGLLLSVLFTAMMQVVLRPYGRLRGLVTGEPVETPGQALNRLKGQATGLAQATCLHQTDPTDTPAADATRTAPTAPDPAPATGTVTVRYRPTRPDHTPTWARDTDENDDHEGGPRGTPMATRPDLDQDPRVDAARIYAVPTAGNEASSSNRSGERVSNRAVPGTLDPDLVIGEMTRGGQGRASQLVDFARSQGWVRSQTSGGSMKFVDENAVQRLTLKSGSARTLGSEAPHVEIRNVNGQRVDPHGNPVTRKSPSNHLPIDWDLT
jgi:hypothetical protein